MWRQALAMLTPFVLDRWEMAKVNVRCCNGALLKPTCCIAPRRGMMRPRMISDAMQRCLAKQCSKVCQASTLYCLMLSGMARF